MKATILSYSIITALAFIFLVSIALISYSYLSTFEESFRDATANLLAYHLISEISQIYQKGSNISNNEIILEKRIVLPEKLYSNDYRIGFVANDGWYKLVISLDGIEKNFDLPRMQINLVGEAKGGEIMLVYNRSVINGEIKNSIIIK
ncbi:MAG: hypothetical protein N3E38_02380 [Candidatus Aenigmarchaeota archaeon]|nr:hypothetical protein [Candidatus Aenigmarchaeota archaeon]